MSGLKELREITKDLIVLHVEDSKAIQKQVGNFLKKLFKEVYNAEDGLDGIEKYKIYNPDLVLTDLTMPNMNGQDMIANLKKINPKIEIIIVSAHSDAQNLLESVKMGVSDFIPKPINNELLQKALFDSVQRLTNTQEVVDNNPNDLFKKLDIICKSNTDIKFLNHYKGVSINDKGKIVRVDKSKIFVKVSTIQALVITHEKKTTIESDLIDGDVEANFLEVDSDENLVLNNFSILEFSSKKRMYPRVEPSDNFKIVLFYKKKRFQAKINDISIKSFSLSLKNSGEADFQVDEDVDLAFSFNIKSKVGYNTLTNSEKISCKGKIFKIDKTFSSIDFILMLDLSKTEEEALRRYIGQRQVEIIEEFKRLK